MKNKHICRSGFGLSQIMALLLVVLPTMVFAIMLLLDYWNVMQVDYKLKLIANQVSDRADSMEDLTNFSIEDRGLCPKGTSLVFSDQIDSTGKGYIDVTIKYNYNGSYFKNKVLSTSMHTYSYHDQNMSIVGTCQ
jgi:Flp pilus assembly protein TadG